MKPMKAIRWSAVVAAASLVAACTSGPHPTAAPSRSGPPPGGGGSASAPPASAAASPLLCNGTAGKTLLTGLLAELNAGRTPSVDTYFSPPIDFVRWWDPTTPEVITFLPGPTDNSITLDALQAHLKKLARGGFNVRLVDFTDLGYQANGVGEEGGWFNFDVHGHATRSAAADGSGKGAVDCASGRLKVLVVDGW